MSVFRRFNRRAITWDRVFGDGVPASRSYAGKSVNEVTAMKYSVVYSCATLIADSVSSLPPEASRVITDDSGDKSSEKKIAVDLPLWIRKPHPSMRRVDVFNQLLLSVLLWGNAYGLLVRRESDGVLNGMLPLDPSRVTCEWDSSRAGFRHYKIDNGPWLTERDIFHIQGPTLPGDACGMSVVSSAREAIGLGLTLEEFGARYFAQGSMAKVVIKIPGKVLSEAENRQVVKNYEMFHKGPGNWHRPAVLSGGGQGGAIDIQNISIPPEDAQFLETREFQALEIARWYRVPPHRVGIISKQSSWGSGLAEENMAMVQNTFRPWIGRLEDALTSYSPGGEDGGVLIRLNVSEMIRGSFKEMVDAWGGAVTQGIATPNEGRKAIGLEPVDGGDDLVKPPDPNAAPPGGEAPFSRAARFNKVHDKSGKFSTVHSGPGYSDLDAKGRAAVDSELAANGISIESLTSEIDSTVGRADMKAARDWYPNANKKAVELADKYGVSTEQAAAVISATSPRTAWPRNLKQADRVLAEQGKYKDLSAKDSAKHIGGALTANSAIGVEIARGAPIDTTLTGVKRRSFYNNIVSPNGTNDVTVDMWMQRSLTNASSKGITDDQAAALTRSKRTVTQGAGAGYVAVTEAVRRVAISRGESTGTIQSAYWIVKSGSISGGRPTA